jgi:hypothetical protein
MMPSLKSHAAMPDPVVKLDTTSSAAVSVCNRQSQLHHVNYYTLLQRNASNVRPCGKVQVSGWSALHGRNGLMSVEDHHPTRAAASTTADHENAVMSPVLFRHQKCLE